MTRALDDETIDGTLGEVLRVLDRLPFVSSVKRDVQALRQLLYRRRAPRIAAFGVPGSGRTSLANALLGKDVLPAHVEPCRWIRIDADGALLDWLEVPLGSDGETALALKNALEDSPADIALIVCAPRDLDGGLTDAMPELSSLLEQLDRREEAVAVLTHSDTLGVPEDEEGHAIGVGLTQLRQALREGDLQVRHAFAVSSTDGHGVRPLSEALMGILPDPARIEAARALVHAPAARRDLANRIVHSASTLALTVGLAPVPFSDVLVIAPLQVTMVSAVAHLSGRPWDRKAVTEWLASVGVVGSAGMGLRWTARQLLKLVPGAGTLVSAGVAGAGTVSMGQSAIAYFLRGDRKLLGKGAEAAARG